MAVLKINLCKFRDFCAIRVCKSIIIDKFCINLHRNLQVKF